MAAGIETRLWDFDDVVALVDVREGAPKVGQQAPAFALRDTSGNVVTLQNLVTSSPRGVLLIFYRGYW